MSRFQRILRVLHRDVGYFLCVLVCLYCISGIAVNHIEDWNPSYSTSLTEVELGPLPTDASLDALEAEVVARAGLDPAEVAGRHRKSPTRLVVFLPNGGEAAVDLATGRGTVKRVSTRAFLFEANVLHLNHLKGVWTWVADVFSLLLLGLALSGLFMLKGPQGLKGRGKWLVGAGALVPIGFLVFYYLTR